MKEKPSFREANQVLFDGLDREYVNAKSRSRSAADWLSGKGSPVYLEVSADYLQAQERSAAVSTEEVSTEAVSAAAVPTAAVTGAVVQTAQNQPMTEEKLLRQMKKTGNSPFYFENLEIILEGNCFWPGAGF